jgi:hypothetical protein
VQRHLIRNSSAQGFERCIGMVSDPIFQLRQSQRVKMPVASTSAGPHNYTTFFAPSLLEPANPRLADAQGFGHFTRALPSIAQSQHPIPQIH